jgi:NAD(P) transhydrogenase subunit alpha
VKKEDAPATKRTPSVRPAPHVAEPKPKAAHGHGAAAEDGAGSSWALLGLAVVIAGIGQFAPPGFLSHLTVFVLACFVGWRVVWNVTPALHTPLMSVTNAISGIILVGGMLSIGGPISAPATILGALAIFFSAINVAGGFLVTQRMLRMFRK